MASRSLTEQVQRLDAALRTVAPGASAKAPSAKAIAHIEAFTGPLHVEVRELWDWGLAPQLFGLGELGFDDEQVWLSPDEAAEALGVLREAPQFPRTLVPLSTDEAGNYACHDAASGHILDWDHETRATRLLSKSLVAFLDSRRVKAERAARERARAARQPAPKPPPTTGAMPRGLRKLVSPELTRFDSKGFGGGAELAAMSEDGRWTAIGLSSSTVLWDGATRTEIELEGRFRSSSMLAFDPSGTRLVRGVSSEVWILETSGKLTHRWAFEPFRPVRAGFSHDGELVFCLAESGLDVWRIADLPRTSTTKGNAKESKPLGRLAPAQPGGYCLDVGVADDGTMLLLRTVNTYSDCELTLWQPSVGRIEGTSTRAGWPSVVALSPDGGRAAIGMRDGEILLVAARDGLKVEKAIQAAHGDGGVTGLAYDRAGRVLVSSGKGELKLWDAMTGKPLAKVPAAAKNRVARVCTVTATHALCCAPLALFELRY